MIRKAFKFRLYPTKEQAILIEKTFGCTRFAFNVLLASQKRSEDVWNKVNRLIQSGVLG